MPILNIAGYKFIPLIALDILKEKLLGELNSFNVKGTILLSEEGINLSLAGDASCLQRWMAQFAQDARFADIRFHQTHSDTVPFKRTKVKIKKEIITLRRPSVDVARERAASISPAEFKRWLDEKKDITVLDTRNEYEIEMGAFSNAKNLHLDDFSEFPDTIAGLDKEKPIVMYCTGGVRCEKAAIYMQQQGYQQVYQLDGGILGYFAQVGGAHYEGNCFVFDERVALDADLVAAKG